MIDPSPSPLPAAATAAVAVAVAVITVLVYHREQIRRIAKSRGARRELRRIAARKAGEGGGGGPPRVSGIFIHPGECPVVAVPFGHTSGRP